MTSIICLCAVILDRIMGDPKKLPHPVMWIGKLISTLENLLNKGNYRKLKGAILVFYTIFVTFLIVSTICYVSYQVHWLLGIGIEVFLVAMALAQKSLEEAAMLVYNALKENDFLEARQKLGWIVGRDTAHLDEPEIVRGVVETVSENTSDGVTAPLFYALLFGATGAWVYKAINTLDSMIGYKNERYSQFGFVAAKLDDLANFLPSRITGLCLLLFTKNEMKLSFKKRLKLWLQDAKKHPSPNSGYLEAATAYQLGIRLGGYNRYGGKEFFRSYMGDMMVMMERNHILKSVRHMYIVTLYFLFIIGGIVFGVTVAWSKCFSFI